MGQTCWTECLIDGSSVTNFYAAQVFSATSKTKMMRIWADAERLPVHDVHNVLTEYELQVVLEGLQDRWRASTRANCKSVILPDLQVQLTGQSVSMMLVQLAERVRAT